MAHTIFHNEQIAQQVAANTPRSTVEQARQRRRLARRTVLDRMLPETAAPSDQTRTPQQQTSQSGGDGQLSGNAARDVDQFGLNFGDLAAFSATDPTTQAATFGLGLLGLAIPGLSFAIGTARLGSMDVGQSVRGSVSGNVSFGQIGGGTRGTPGSFEGGNAGGDFGSAAEVASAAAFSDAADVAEFGQDVNTSIGRNASDFGDTSGGIGADTNGNGQEGGPSGGTGGVGEGGGIGL